MRQAVLNVDIVDYYPSGEVGYYCSVVAHP